MTDANGLFVGIDVSKRQVVVSVHGRDESWEFQNDAEGVAKLVSLMQGVSPELIVVEATGAYERLMVAELQAAGLPTAVVNPTRVRRFADSLGELAKTDKIDARMIAHFASAVRPPARTGQSEEEKYLAGLVERRRQLIVMLTAEKNRLHSAPLRLRPDVQEHVEWLQAKLSELDEEIEGMIGNNPK